MSHQTGPNQSLHAFSSMDLDARIQKGLKKQGFTHASLVQHTAIPLLLRGRDVLAQAKTGSGKTLAYLIPALSLLYGRPESEDKGPFVVVLVPTAELAKQVSKVARALISGCGGGKTVGVATREMLFESLEAKLKNAPDVLVCTPGRLVQIVKKKFVSLANVALLCVDEADLFFSYGFQNDIPDIAARLPPSHQSVMVSATMDQGVEELNGLLLNNPALIRLEDASAEPEESGAGGGRLREFCAQCKDDDKFLITYALLKLGVLPGKTLIFVNTIDKCYKLKLFLDRFGLNAAVLNADLPVNSRLSVIERFNRDRFDILIATDKGIADCGRATAAVQGSDDDSSSGDVVEFSAARGVDFVGVANVINFDMPSTVTSYTHRVGRTARGGASGLALSLVAIDASDEVETAEMVADARLETGTELKPFEFKTTSVEGLRYRVEDMLGQISIKHVRDARAAALRNEMINSERLKAHFDDNPRELHLLRHNAPSDAMPTEQHLTYLPAYLLPDGVDEKAINKSAERSRLPTMRNAERRREEKGKKAWKRAHKGSLEGYVSILEKARQTNDDGAGWGIGKRGQSNDGRLLTKRQRKGMRKFLKAEGNGKRRPTNT